MKVLKGACIACVLVALPAIGFWFGAKSKYLERQSSVIQTQQIWLEHYCKHAKHNYFLALDRWGNYHCVTESVDKKLKRVALLRHESEH